VDGAVPASQTSGRARKYYAAADRPGRALATSYSPHAPLVASSSALRCIRQDQAGSAVVSGCPAAQDSRRRAPSAAALVRSPRPAAPRPGVRGTRMHGRCRRDGPLPVPCRPAADLDRHRGAAFRTPRSLRSLRSLEDFAGTPPVCPISVSTRSARRGSPYVPGSAALRPAPCVGVHVVARAAVGSMRAARTAG
jgi:hypothetical protein